MALINGTKRADKIHGTDGNDTINGREGNDTFYGSGGDDRIDGGSGWDKIDYAGYGGRLEIVLKSSGESYLYGDGVLRDTLVSVEEILGGNGDDYFAGNGRKNIFSGGKGHDYILASNGDDVYRGGNGYDMVDFSKIKTGLKFAIDSATGVTSVRHGENLATMTGVENVIGTKYGDVIKGTGANNYFLGMGGNDTLIGGAGGDGLNGGTGNDKLTGGADDDVFEFNTGFGRDTITDFNSRNGEHDILDFKDVAAIRSYDQLISEGRIAQNGSDVHIDAANGDMIILKNVDIASLSASDFLF